MKLSSLISHFVLLAALLCAAALLFSPASAQDCPLCADAADGDLSGIEERCRRSDAGDIVDRYDNAVRKRTALLLAAKEAVDSDGSHHEVAMSLLEGPENCGQANPNLGNRNGRTPFMWAVQNDNVDLAMALLDAADDHTGFTSTMAFVNRVKTNDNRNALDIAFDREEVNIGFLITLISDFDGSFSSHSIMTDAQRTALKNFFDMKSPDSPADGLLLAASEGNDIVVDVLLTLGVDVNYQDDDGKSALHFAADGGYTDVVRVLTRNLSLNVNQRDFSSYGGETALYLATNNDGNYVEIVRLLLDRQDLTLTLHNISQQPSYPVFHFAGFQGTAMVAAFLERDDLDVNVQSYYEIDDVYGDTALHHAIRYGQEEVFLLLMDQPHLDVNISRADVISPLMYAIQVAYYPGEATQSQLDSMLTVLLARPELVIHEYVFSDVIYGRGPDILRPFLTRMSRPPLSEDYKDLFQRGVYTAVDLIFSSSSANYLQNLPVFVENIGPDSPFRTDCDFSVQLDGNDNPTPFFNGWLIPELQMDPPHFQTVQDEFQYCLSSLPPSPGVVGDSAVLGASGSSPVIGGEGITLIPEYDFEYPSHSILEKVR